MLMFNSLLIDVKSAHPEQEDQHRKVLTVLTFWKKQSKLRQIGTDTAKIILCISLLLCINLL